MEDKEPIPVEPANESLQTNEMKQEGSKSWLSMQIWSCHECKENQSMRNVYAKHNSARGGVINS